MLATAEELPSNSGEEPFVRLPSDRLEGERAAAGRVIADRGHPALIDRQ